MHTTTQRTVRDAALGESVTYILQDAHEPLLELTAAQRKLWEDQFGTDSYYGSSSTITTSGGSSTYSSYRRPERALKIRTRAQRAKDAAEKANGEGEEGKTDAVAGADGADSADDDSDGGDGLAIVGMAMEALREEDGCGMLASGTSARPSSPSDGPLDVMDDAMRSDREFQRAGGMEELHDVV